MKLNNITKLKGTEKIRKLGNSHFQHGWLRG